MANQHQHQHFSLSPDPPQSEVTTLVEDFLKNWSSPPSVILSFRFDFFFSNSSSLLPPHILSSILQGRLPSSSSSSSSSRSLSPFDPPTWHVSFCRIIINNITELNVLRCLLYMVRHDKEVLEAFHNIFVDSFGVVGVEPLPGILKNRIIIIIFSSFNYYLIQYHFYLSSFIYYSLFLFIIIIFFIFISQIGNNTYL